MKNYSPNSSLLKILGSTTLGLAVGIPALTASYQRLTIEEHICAEVQRILAFSPTNYLVFTDKGIFTNAISMGHWKFDPAAIHQTFNTSEQFDIKTYGWNIPALSFRPNIIQATPNPNCTLTKEEHPEDHPTPHQIQSSTNSRLNI